MKRFLIELIFNNEIDLEKTKAEFDKIFSNYSAHKRASAR
jgi:hypothetical protein